MTLPYRSKLKAQRFITTATMASIWRPAPGRNNSLIWCWDRRAHDLAEKIQPRQTNKPFITHKVVTSKSRSSIKVDGSQAHKQLSEYFLELCGSLLILLLHPLHLYGTNEQIGSMAMSKRMQEMPIQGSDLIKQEVRNEKAVWWE